MLLWTDASFYEDAENPIAAIAVVQNDNGKIWVSKLVDVATSVEAERAAVVEAFGIARRQQESVVIRTDCQNVSKLSPPKGVKLQKGYRKENVAHSVACRVAKAEVHERAQIARILGEAK